MITLIHLLPSLLNLYGDGANLEVLKRELEAAGEEAQIAPWKPGAEVDFSAAGLIYAGPGTERRIEKALELLMPYKEALASAKAVGVPMLFCGTAAELAGAALKLDGEERPALGLARHTAVRFGGRQTGDVLYRTALSDRLLAGFINKSSRMEGGENPPFKAEFGIGGICDENGKDTGAEGALDGSLLATYCTGPILVRNPWLRRLFAKRILSRADPSRAETDLPETEDYFDRGYEITVSELKKRII